MDHSNTLRRCLVALAAAGAFAAGTASAQSGAVDLGTSVPDPQSVKEGLFPEDACKELEANGFKCMGFKPAIRYSLPATSFAVGSADLPDGLKKQLDVFADVLKGKKGGGRQVRVIGHADASGSADANQALSRMRRCWSPWASARASRRTPPIRPRRRTAASNWPASSRRSSKHRCRNANGRPRAAVVFAGARNQGIWWFACPACLIEITGPGPKLQTSVQFSSSAGWLPIITFGTPGTHGAAVIGVQGIGVSTPIAAEVAAATAGLAMLWQAPNGGMLTNGLWSMMLAAGTLFVMTRLIGSTTSVLGAMPNWHCIIAPMQT
jgi:OOP family OmpA-OmpF porin